MPVFFPVEGRAKQLSAGKRTSGKVAATTETELPAEASWQCNHKLRQRLKGISIPHGVTSVPILCTTSTSICDGNRRDSDLDPPMSEGPTSTHQRWPALLDLSPYRFSP